MENIYKYLAPIILGTSISINGCAKKQELPFAESPQKVTESSNPIINNLAEVETGVFNIDDRRIPKPVQDRFNKMVLLSNRSEGDCRVNPVTIDGDPSFITSAHCRKKTLTYANEKFNLIDAPVFSRNLADLRNSNLSNIRIFPFPKANNGEIIYMVMPTVAGNPNSRKVFVGHAQTINTENGQVLTTQENYPGLNANGSSGSFVSNKDGRILGVIKGALRIKNNLVSEYDENDLPDSILKYTAITGRNTDKSKKVIIYTKPNFFGFQDGSNSSKESWVTDSQKTKK